MTPDRPLPNDDLVNLAFLTLDHAIDSVSEGETLIPFVMVENKEAKGMRRFVGNTFEESVGLARAELRSLHDEAILRAALAYDGYFTDPDGRNDAVYVEVQDATEQHGYLFVQRYRPKTESQKFETMGNAALVDTVNPLLS